MGGAVPLVRFSLEMADWRLFHLTRSAASVRAVAACGRHEQAETGIRSLYNHSRDAFASTVLVVLVWNLNNVSPTPAYLRGW